MRRPRPRAPLIAAAVLMAATACGCAVSGTPDGGHNAAAEASGAVIPAAVASPSASPSPSPSPSPRPSPPPLPLAGRVVGIDPGHNGGNFSDPGYISQQIWNGREYENCDTTGTEAADGFTEASFNFAVATDLRADLIAAGATVVMTRDSNDGVGPCVTTRAQIINDAHAQVALDIHADGGPVSGRGFTILEPVADGPNDAVIAASQQLGADVRAAILRDTPMPESDYYGTAGVIYRDDLAGLNLTTVPKVLVECGNMPNQTDASLLQSPTFQQQLARALTAAIIAFLAGEQG